MTEALVLRTARITNPNAFYLQEVQDLFLAWNHDPEKWLSAVGEILADRGACIVGAVGERLAGLALISLPNKMVTDCQVIHFHCDGGPKLRRMMVQEVVNFVQNRGYTGFIAVNGTGKPDSVWARAFRGAGVARTFGSVVEFKFDERTIRRINSEANLDARGPDIPGNRRVARNVRKRPNGSNQQRRPTVHRPARRPARPKPANRAKRNGKRGV